MASKRDALIFKLYADGKSQTAIAEQFCLSQGSISLIIKKLAKEYQETGTITIEKETSYPHSQGGFWASDEQNAHIETMTAKYGSYSAAMRQIINRSLSITNTTKQE